MGTFPAESKKNLEGPEFQRSRFEGSKLRSRHHRNFQSILKSQSTFRHRRHQCLPTVPHLLDVPNPRAPHHRPVPHRRIPVASRRCFFYIYESFHLTRRVTDGGARAAFCSNPRYPPRRQPWRPPFPPPPPPPRPPPPPTRRGHPPAATTQPKFVGAHLGSFLAFLV